MNAQRGRLARAQARRRQRERIGGLALAVIGVVVAVVAVIALTNPRDSGSSPGAVRTTTVAPSAGTSASTSARPSTTSSGLRSATTAGTTSPSGSAVLGTDGVALKRVPLVVLNNTTTTGLAAAAAQRFEQGGWTVTSSGNYSNDIVSTCAYYDPDTADAEQAAEALQAQFPTIKRVRPRFADLPAGPVVVVLTPDYESA